MERREEITIDGREFTTLQFDKSQAKPYFYPVKAADDPATLVNESCFNASATKCYQNQGPRMPGQVLTLANPGAYTVKWFSEDIKGNREAVKSQRLLVAAVGMLPDAKAARVIDAGGKVLAPGFIDVHTHVESGIEKWPPAENFVRDGVTTVVTGGANWSSSRIRVPVTMIDSDCCGSASISARRTASREMITAPDLSRLAEIPVPASMRIKMTLNAGLIFAGAAGCWTCGSGMPGCVGSVMEWASRSAHGPSKARPTARSRKDAPRPLAFRGTRHPNGG